MTTETMDRTAEVAEQSEGRRGSAFPPSIASLIPQAEALAAELGEVPSRNRLKTELKIGAPKAATIRDALLKQAEGRQRMRDMHTYLVARKGSTASLPDEAREPWDRQPASEAEGGGEGPALRAVPELLDGRDQEVTEADSRVVPLASDVPMASDVDKASAMEAETASRPVRRRRLPVGWPVLLLAAPAFVAIWSGWVGLGELTGFGVVHPLPGIADGFTINSAITLPIGVEAYAAYALRAWLAGNLPRRAKRFAMWSALGSLLVGCLGQVTYHVLTAPETGAPLWITTIVSCLPVVVLGLGAALMHLMREREVA